MSSAKDIYHIHLISGEVVDVEEDPFAYGSKSIINRISRAADNELLDLGHDEDNLVFLFRRNIEYITVEHKIEYDEND